jgi:hypothetical protein
MQLDVIVMESVDTPSPLFFLSTLLLLTIGMVNFNDPAVIASDVGSCFCLSLGLGSSPGPPFSGTQEVPVFSGWFLHVGLPLSTMYFIQ